MLDIFMNHQYHFQLHGYISHFENRFYTKMKWKLHLIAHFWAQKVQTMSTIYTVMFDHAGMNHLDTTLQTTHIKHPFLQNANCLNVGD